MSHYKEGDTNMLKKDMIIKYNHNTFLVIDSKVIDNVNYAFIIDINNHNKFMFCQEKNNKLVEINNPDMITLLSFEFQNNQ